MATVKDGQYYYAPHRRLWGVWQHHDLGDGYATGEFYGDFATKEAARRKVYELNGWIYNEQKK